MHEFSIATQLMKQVLAVAEENQLAAVEEVELEIGALQMIVPEALEMAFEALRVDTCAAGARLVQRETPVKARCNECDHLFEAEIDQFQCPQCKKADIEVEAGRDIILKSVSGPPMNAEKETT